MKLVAYYQGVMPYADRISGKVQNTWLENRLLQEESGLHAGGLCRKINKSVNFLAQVEGTGTTRGVSLETLFKMAAVLQIPASKLLEDD